jgi:2-oxoisovalerate dehydrogenase E2 component (dihydrolipoyl transacylase)
MIFRLPDLGEGLDEAEVIAWRVQVGDTVTVDQIVVEVETAKAAVEVPIPFAGTVSVLHVPAGSTLAVGSPLISVQADEGSGFREPGFSEPGVVLPDAAPAPIDPASTSPAGSADESSGNVLIGYGTSSTPRRQRRRALRPTANVTGGRAETGPAEPAHPAEAAQLSAPAGTGPVPVISPLVRKLARDAGVDLHRIAGTGPSGLVRRSDVDQAMAGPASTSAGETRVPLRGLRRAVADKLSRSRREIPEATVWVDVDATELLATRALLNARRPHEPVSLIGLLGRFTVLGLHRYPELNARVEPDEIVINEHVHLGFAAQTDRGLVVPVVRDAHELTTRELAAAIATRTTAARSGQLELGELTGGTFTVNNYGVFGVDGSAAIINHPEVAILGMGRIIDRPWVVDGQITIRKITELTLAFDHRVCDGGTAGGFLCYVADCVESPVLALGEM